MTGQDQKNKAIRYSEFLVEVPFLDRLDILVEPDAEAPRLVVDLKREHLNGGGQAHGGLLMTMLDMAMAAAARSASLSKGEQQFYVTVEMKTNFIRPGGIVGGKLTASGRLRHTTKTMAFCEGDLVDGEGKLVATSSGTFKLVGRAISDAP